MTSVRYLFLLALVMGSASLPVFAQSPFTRNSMIAESCRLAEEQRYADSVVMAERLRLLCPEDPAAMETSGAVALLVGATSNARTYFAKALSESPDDPIALYGKAMAALVSENSSVTTDSLDAIDLSSVPDVGKQDIVLVKAISEADQGLTDKAQETVADSAGKAEAELAALLVFRNNPDNLGPLTRVLADSMMNGIPVVVEPPGLRLLLPEDKLSHPVEPSITDSDTQQELGSRFDSTYITGGSRLVTGKSIAIPPRRVTTFGATVTFSVDGDEVGESNSVPIRFTWDSGSVANGQHTLTYSIYDSSGTRTSIEVENVYVLNLDQSPSENRGDLPPALAERIWRLLQVKPDYKVAEYSYALGALRGHDQDGYETHLLRAAALDTSYRDVLARIKSLFVGQVPTKYPVPDGTTLPSSLGLSAGAASAAGFWAGNPSIKEIALTFDDGPLPGPTKDLLDALRSANAIGTFFVVGMRAAESPDSLRQMAADGDCIEDHSFTHPNLTQVLPEHILPEILKTAVVIQAATGVWPHFLRPPGGNTNSAVLQAAKLCGMSGAFWTIDALPAEESGSPEAVTNWVIARARPGAIVLMHNGMATTVAAIPQMVQGLRNHGYKLVTIRQLATDALSKAHAGT